MTGHGVASEASASVANGANVANVTVVCARHLLADDVAEEVEDACAKIGVQIQRWRGEPLSDPGGQDVGLVVAGLGKGQRRVPDDLVQLLDTRYPATPLLLLCHDKLLRPQMSLQGGRITLLGPPAVGPRIRSAIRALVADRVGGPSVDTLRGVAGARVQVVAQRIDRSQWWLGTLGTRRHADREESAALPMVHHRRLDGLVALLPPPGAERPGATQLSQVLHLLRSHRHGDLEGPLARTLGDTAMIHLGTGEREWIVHWPDRRRPLWLYSVLRLPSLWNLTRTLKGTLVRMRAAGADLLAATNAPPPLSPQMLSGESRGSMRAAQSAADPRDEELASALALGGAGALQFLESSLRDLPQVSPFSAVLVEVR